MTASPTTSAGAAPDLVIALPSDDVPFEGVPHHLIGPLRDWIEEQVSQGPDFLAKAVVIRLRMGPRNHNVDYWSELVYAAPSELLRVCNGILWFHSAEIEVNHRDLDAILGLGGSVYTVSDRAPIELQRRVDPETKAARDQATKDAPPAAASHLTLAWNAAFGMDPEPNAAYAEAVKVVECVAIPLMCPNAKNPTLGSVLTVLRGASQAASPAWQLDIPAQDGSPAKVETLAFLIELLWHGQRSRHAGGASSRSQTQAEAEHVVVLAVLLVRWFSTGFVQKV